MKFGNRTMGSDSPAPTDLRSFLGEGTEIAGEIKFSEIMRVDASVSGSVTSDNGSLLVMERGIVKASVTAGTVEISGTVEGTVTAKTSVKIHSTGRVYGDIFTPALIIEHGAVFDGKCHMLDKKQQQQPSKPLNEVNKPIVKPETKPLPDPKNLKTADAV